MKTTLDLPADLIREMKLPLIECQAAAKELTADQVAEVMLKQEVEWSHEAAGR